MPPAFLTVGTAAAAKSPVVDVWLILGDSEAAQGGVLTGPLPNFIPPPVGTNVLKMVNQNDLETVSELSLPSGKVTGAWSLAAPFAYYRWLQTGRVQLVCDCAVDGTTSTYYHTNLTSSPPSGYYRAVTSVLAALAEPNTQFRGILIYGGANDASGGSPDWGTNWTTGVSNVETGIGRTAEEIVFMQLPPGPPGAPYNTSWSTVRTQQAAWAGGRKYMVAQVDTGPWSDIQYVHLNGEGLDNTARLICTTRWGSIPEPTVVQPSSIANLYRHFRSSTAGVSGGVVDDLTDLVGASVKLVATSTARPAYTADGGSSWNNKAIITFDSSNDVLQANDSAANWALLGDGSGVTVFAPFYASGANVDVLSTYMGSGAGGILIRLTGGYLTCWVDNGSGFGAPYISGTTFRVTAPTVKRTFLTYRMATGNASLRHRGSKWVTPVGYVGSPPASCSYAVKLGSGFYFGGGIFNELIVYNRVLTDTECDKVGNYLTQYWNLEKWA